MKKTKQELIAETNNIFKEIDISWRLMKRTVCRLIDAFFETPDAKEYIIEISESDSEKVFSYDNSIPMFLSILNTIGMKIKSIDYIFGGTIIKVSLCNSEL